jgi:hypothetical protein
MRGVSLSSARARALSTVVAAVILTVVGPATIAAADTTGPSTGVPIPGASKSSTPDDPGDETPPGWESPDPSTDVPLPDSDPRDGPTPTNGPTFGPATNPDCNKWHIDRWKKFDARLGQVGPSFSSYFGNGGTQTLQSGISGTLGASASTTLEGSLSAVSIVTAKASVSASLSASATVSASISEAQPVKVGYWGNAFWGAQRQPVRLSE